MFTYFVDTVEGFVSSTIFRIIEENIFSCCQRILFDQRNIDLKLESLYIDGTNIEQIFSRLKKIIVQHNNDLFVPND